MGAFDSFADTPDQIKTEGEQIILKFLPGVPAQGQGTLQWNIPPPAQGCTSTDDVGRYCGFVILASNTPLTGANIPVDGTMYEGDPTVDPNKHTGDKVKGAFVVSALYEGEKRANNQTLTTSVVISDLKPGVAYYFGGYAVDCQYRYHKDGVRAYSLDSGKPDEPGTPGVQIVQLGDNSQCVMPTDGTGLLPGAQYQFEIIVDDNFPKSDNVKNILITLDGERAETYQDLLTEINKQIAQGCNGSTVQSPVPPNSGTYYWNGTKIQLWNGSSLEDVDVIYETSDPAAVAVGDYWFNPETQELFIRTGTGWSPVNVTILSVDPTSSFTSETYWFTGTHAYVRCGNTWCERPLHITTEDPSKPLTVECSTYWYDQYNLVLNVWDPKTYTWKQTSAVAWDTDPLSLNVGTYWYDLNTDLLFSWNGTSWVEEDVVVSSSEPAYVVPGMLWFNPNEELLHERNAADDEWVPQEVLVWPGNPSSIETCDLWWNTTNDQLYKWDIANNEWDLVDQFFQSEDDPLTPPVLEVNEFWYNPDTGDLWVWDGVVWICVENYLTGVTDPTVPTTGGAWLNPTNNVINIWNGTTWVPINPTTTTTDPTTIAQGAMWFNTSTNIFYIRIGLSWTPVAYTTTLPTPSRGTVWYDTSSNKLMTWNGKQWVEKQPCVTATINQKCDLEFVSSVTGSKSVVIVPVPYDLPQTGQACAARVAADMDESIAFCQYYGSNPKETQKYIATYISPEGFLFANLVPTATVLGAIQGTDGVSGTPSYDRIGVGDDGTPDERRKLMDSIRQMLGYPVIEVELTQTQLDQAVQNALETFRQHSSLSYKRACMFLDIKPYKQTYKLTNEAVGMHKIVNVMAIYRFTSSFLSSAHGAGVYGQIVMQHLYNMGTFDLLSFHIVSDYVEQLEMLFATRPTFHWDEPSRELTIYQSYVRNERVLLDVAIERTEQEIFTDRWAKRWVQRYALAEAMDMLSQVRGKYSTLPGAGGGVTLNASDLSAKADKIKEDLMKELEDLTVQDVEDYGIGAVMTIG